MWIAIKWKFYGARAKLHNCRLSTFAFLYSGHLSLQSDSLLKTIAHKLARKAHAPADIGYATSYNALITSFRTHIAFAIARGTSMCLRADRDLSRHYRACLRQQKELAMGYTDLFMGMDLLTGEGDSTRRAV